MTTALNNPNYMQFPLRIGPQGALTSARSQHVRQQIEQVLFTDPGERWYRPDFGLGVKALIFEPNSQALWEISKKRLTASLNDALAGEVDPASLVISVSGEQEQLIIGISYTLATINHTETLEFAAGINAHNGGA